jgi:LysR family transcriptional activator of nhaA
MEWLNYHHLLYFWMVAREGSIVQAGEKLHLAQPTLSNQIRKLEQSLGMKLFQKDGRKLVLTDAGPVAYRYAVEIFGLGRELTDALQGISNQDELTLTVGVPDVLPKLVVYRLLKPALKLPETVHLVLFEGKLDQLLSDLALHRLDAVLSDSPLSAGSNIRAFNHLLGECGVSFFATCDQHERLSQGFPRSLNGEPMLLPTHNTAVRRALELWFEQSEIRPRVKHEFEDSALLKVFGAAGEGIFCAPSAIEAEVESQYRVRSIGQTPLVLERFYAISVERRLKHPAVIAIIEAARSELFRDA